MVSPPGTVKVLNDATSQRDRVLSAPAPGLVEVDGRSLAQLIAFGAQYGALIAFYDLENQQSGTWEEFFASDPSVALAMHAALDMPDIQRALQSLLADLRAALEAGGGLAQFLRLLAALARLLGILDRKRVTPGDADALITRFARRGANDSVGDPLARLQRHLGQGSVQASLTQGFGRGRRWVETLYEILEDFVATLLAELKGSVAATIIELDVSLHSAGHAPQAALYNAFAILLTEARATLNGFPRRLVEFYYGDVLEQHALEAQPDHLFLTFTRATGADQASVPRGALFPAGNDAQGAAIDYAADNALEVTPAAVEAITIHRVTFAPAGIGHLPSGVLSGRVAVDPKQPAAPTPFPLFGLPKAGTKGPITMEEATLGFCIGSQLLMLSGGTRTVTIGVFVTPMIAQLPDAAPDTGLLDEVVQAIRAAMELHYSTPGGWVKVDGFDVEAILELGTQMAQFTLSFVLSPDAPPVLAVDAKPPPNTPPPPLPADTFPSLPGVPMVVATLKLDRQQQPTAFALLSTTVFDEISLDVQVRGLEAVTLRTPNGPADTSQNFAVFGLPPAQGSTLEIYSPELFAKPVDGLSVTISWAGLPVTTTGFKGYYSNYLIDADGKLSPFPLFDNTSFRVGFGVADPGYWKVDTSVEPCLFQDPSPPPTPLPTGSAQSEAIVHQAGPVAVQSVLWIPIAGTRLTAPAYYNPSGSALQLTLTQPSYAFGNILYSNNLMYASQKAIPPPPTPTPAPSGSGVAPSADAQVANLAKVNATAPDRTYTRDVAGAVKSAISSLTGEALAAVRQAIGLSGADGATQSSLFQDLEDALAAAASAGSSPWSWLTGGSPVGEAVAVLEALRSWVAEHEQQVSSSASAPALNHSKSLLASAKTIADTHAANADQSTSLARANMAAATQKAQTAVLPPALPNPPWLPMASALSVDYHASLSTPILAPPSPSAPPGVPGEVTIDLGFWHVGPFGSLSTPDPSGTGHANLLPPIHDHAALYIQLSAPVSQVSLLFILSAGRDGWWDDPPVMVWEQLIDGKWQACTLLDDTTNGLRNSGIVTLAPKVPAGATKGPRLRVRAHGNTNNAPVVQSVIANAVAATWVGPGGAAQLGTPLPAKTITKSAAPLPGVGSIAQPMQSFGGAPPAVGADFDKWMSERLRHKDYAIDEWDYARIVLQAVPSLWQAAVIPATDEKTGRRAPGKVWVVAVAGKTTPNVTDTTIPQADLATLSDIGELLRSRMSPFAEVAVTNPPYLRLTVDAVLEFSDENTSAYWIDQLQAELVEWLSPWPPDPKLGIRPANYYTRRAIAEFVRHRPYVHGIARLDVRPEPAPSASGHYYLTSALQHHLKPAPVDPVSPCDKTFTALHG